VRRVVGVLVEVGRGKLQMNDVAGLLEQASNVPARLTAPPSGLFLERVFYEGEDRKLPLRAAIPLGGNSEQPVAGAGSTRPRERDESRRADSPPRRGRG
jgi:hypothetical protein